MDKKKYAILIFFVILLIVSISFFYPKEEGAIDNDKEAKDRLIEKEEEEEEIEPLYNLFIDSEPKGLEVYVHSYDEPIVTPETIRIPSGEYRVWVYPENFQPFEKRIKIEDEDKDLFIPIN